MLHQLVRLFRPDEETHHAYSLYAHINECARGEHFFTQWHVPDTLDGRFELIVLHMFLYLHSMKQKPEDTMRLQRRVIEAFFEDMDRSLREFGVGDTGVGRRIKAMANAFYGRIHAYEQALGDDEALAQALRTNLYGTTTPPETVEPVVHYVHTQIAALANQPIHTVEFLDHA
jgi:cytochrome b pre-mRNA-processing protein 3